MTKAKKNSVIAVLLSLTMVFTLVLGVLPNDAHAVTQAEIDALNQKRKQLKQQWIPQVRRKQKRKQLKQKLVPQERRSRKQKEQRQRMQGNQN